MSDRKLTDDADYQVALKGRELVSDPKNWVKERLHEPERSFTGAHCIQGALHAALPDAGWNDNHSGCATRKNYNDTDRILKKMGFHDCTDAVHFNNDPGTTHEMLLTRFDEGLEKMRACLMVVT